MKKAAWILLAAALLWCGALSVHGAGQGKFSLLAEKQSLSRGSEFSVTIRCERNPGVREIALSLSYDTRALTVKEILLTDLFPGGVTAGEAGAERILFSSPSEDFTATGDAATVTFSVRDDAPYGSAAVTVRYDRTTDIRNSAGNAVPFEVQDFSYQLLCPHASVSREVTTPATLSANGVVRVVCDDCGDSWEESVSPELVSEDGMVRAVLPPRIFSEGSDPTLSVEYVYGEKEYDLALSLFGTRLVRAFHIRFATPWGEVMPAGNITVSLQCETSLPEHVSLYAFEDEMTDRVTMEREGDTVTFPWRSALFILAETPVEEEAPEEAAEESVPDATVNAPDDENNRRDGLILALSAAALAGTGVGIYFLLRHKKKY